MDEVGWGCNGGEHSMISFMQQFVPVMQALLATIFTWGGDSDRGLDLCGGGGIDTDLSAH